MVIFTPKGLSVNARVSKMACFKASGLGWVSAVRKPRLSREQIMVIIINNNGSGSGDGDYCRCY